MVLYKDEYVVLDKINSCLGTSYSSFLDQDRDQQTALMRYIKNFKKISLLPYELNIIIKNSDWNTGDRSGFIPIHYLFSMYSEINIPEELLEYIYNNTNFNKLSGNDGNLLNVFMFYCYFNRICKIDISPSNLRTMILNTDYTYTEYNGHNTLAYLLMLSPNTFFKQSDDLRQHIIMSSNLELTYNSLTYLDMQDELIKLKSLEEKYLLYQDML